jgi:hypothetical protein
MMVVVPSGVMILSSLIILSLSGSIPHSVVRHVLLRTRLKIVERYNIAIVPFSWSLRLIEAYPVNDLAAFHLSRSSASSTFD